MAPSEQERRIARVIKEYDLQGWHRSGTEVDGASARWLADRVAGCGLEPTLESFPFDRLDPGLASVETGGRRGRGRTPVRRRPDGAGGCLGPVGCPGLRLGHRRNRAGCRADDPLPQCAPRAPTRRHRRRDTHRARRRLDERRPLLRAVRAPPSSRWAARRARTWLSMPAAASALGSSSRQRVRPPRPAT